MKKSRFIVIMLLFVTINCFANVLNVPENYQIIQEAINESAHMDTILISNGIYNESIDFLGKSIIVASNFILTEDTQDIENTIIDANDSSFHVVNFINSESNNSKLIGLSITGGNANGSEGFNRGGGIYCSNNSQPTIDNCQIYGNYATNTGGGIALEAFTGEVIISNCKIYNNYATGGGGIYLGSIQSGAIISNTELYNNTAVDGAAIMNLFTSSTLNHSSIYSNDATGTGSAIKAFNGFKVYKSLIYENTSNSDAVITISPLADESEPMLLLNSTIVNNSIPENATIELSGNSKLLIVNSIISNYSEIEIIANNEDDTSQIEIDYSDIVRGQNSINIGLDCVLNWADNNIIADPNFALINSSDFELLENSPCIDTGTDNYTYNGTVIFNINQNQYNGTAPDMGCFESNYSISTNGETIHNQCRLSNFPNPFNPTTTINFFLNSTSNVEIEIYNTKGQKINSLKKDNLSYGNQSIIWNGLNGRRELVNSGIYFYTLKVNNKLKAKSKCVLLK